MRLLQCSERGELSIYSFDDDAIPPYAILSHTWGQDGDEVTFADLETGDGRTKPGYEKIRFCGQQARQDGLRYFWVDTCCIDKTDKGELSHAIQSMFPWYQNATRCYVYLSDVSTRKRKFGDALTGEIWEPAFIKSRWFTRGWTLQELLAPTILEFYSQEGKKLGDRVSLQPLILKATSISPEVLNGAPLSQFSVNERLRWAEGRVTRYDEDRAYSLQGILNIELAPVYGEGAAGAFERLRDETRKLERCIQDIYSTDPRSDKKRIEDTKGGLLEDSYRWVLDNITFRQWQEDRYSRLLWVKGDPGKGKTMLLCGIIDELHTTLPRNALLAYFFCQTTDPRINSATAVLRGLLYMLVSQQPSLASHIRNRHDHAGKALFEDANAWVALTEMFADVLQDPQLRTTYLVIDALDECVTDRSKLLDFVAKQSSVSRRAKWIVASRNWLDIEEQLELAERKTRLSLELNAESVAAAVKVFIQQKVNQLTQEKRYTLETKNAVLQHLTLNADGTFLWVALVCQNLRGTPKWNVLEKLAHFPPGLDSLYRQMIDQISTSDSAKICLQVLAVTTALYRPVTVTELVALVQQLEDVNDLESVQKIISLCGSFLTLRDDIVYFVHQSAKDFLVTQASNEVFLNGIECVHQDIFAKSLAILHETLRRDVYNLQAPGYAIEDVKPLLPDPLAVSRYPCVYWVDHFCDSKPSAINQETTRAIDAFLKQKYLYWLEALSLCRSMAKGVVSMTRLWDLVQEFGDTDALNEIMYDARRFIMYHKEAIENYPLQAYASALLFSPADSVVRRLFQHEEPREVAIKPAMSNGWSACLQTLEGHSSGEVSSAAFSHDSARLASASDDMTVKIWDASSGACLRTLYGHSDVINSVAFSHDSTKLASGSCDNTVKLWDGSSGTCLQTFIDHSSPVSSVAFSHDSAKLASASWKETIKIWNVSSGECLQTLKDSGTEVYSVAFSHDSSRLASASYDMTVKIWDASSGACLQTLHGHSGAIYSVAFSHDSTRLASASWDSTVKIWDVSDGICLQTIKGHSSIVSSIAFSHDSSRLASASYDKTVKIWNAESAACLQALKGHSHIVCSVTFSHDSTKLASGSCDNTVKLWDASSGVCVQIPDDHSDRVNSVTFSHDTTQLASASEDHTIKIWNVSSGACLKTLKGHSRGVCFAAFSHNSTQLASASEDYTIKIWNVSSGACLKTLKDHHHRVYFVAFSHDSTSLASASYDQTAKVWDLSSGECLRTFKGHSDAVNSVTFSHDSTKLASTSWDSTVKIWDASSGACLQTLHGHSGAVYSVAFSHNSTGLASASSIDKTVKIWDASNGTCLHTLDVGRALSNISFDSTGTHLYTEVGTIAIPSLQISSGTDIPVPKLLYQGAGICLDGNWVRCAGSKVLWIPSEYRPSSSAVSETQVGIGVGSGRVWVCQVV